MACAPITTGDGFLESTLAHIDCQALLIGSYGYQALGQPGSPASIIVTSLLTIFIALFGIRMIIGPAPQPRDAVFGVIKIGLILALAFSWPTFRTIIYDVTLKGPSEVASVILPANSQSALATPEQRLQAVDDKIMELATEGTGRNSGQFLGDGGPGPNFAGTDLQDNAAFGYSRLLFLTGVIAPLAVLRIVAGILLALTPIVAGLFLFTQSRGVFAGWAKGLAFSFFGSIAVSVGLAIQLSLVEPWLADALRVRQIGFATPAAPLELFAMMLAFLLIHFAVLRLIAKVVFNRGWPEIPVLPESWGRNLELTGRSDQDQPEQRSARMTKVNRHTERVTSSVENIVRREQRQQMVRANAPAPASVGQGLQGSASEPRLGSQYRRPRSVTVRPRNTRDDKA